MVGHPMGLGCSSSLWGAPQAQSALGRGPLLKTLPVTMKGTLCLTSLSSLCQLLEASHPKCIPANRDSPNCTCTYYCDIQAHPYLLLGLSPERAPVPRSLYVPIYVMGPFHPFLCLLLGLLSVPIIVVPLHTHTWYLGPLHESVPITRTLINTYTHYGAPHPYLYSGTEYTHTHTRYWDTCLYL